MPPVVTSVAHPDSPPWSPRDLSADLALLLATLAWLAGLQAVFPSYFLWDDNATFFLPQYAFNWRTLATHGELPLVSFHQYLGYLYHGSGQSAVLYPAVYLAAGLSQTLLGDLRHTMDVLASLHLVGGALAMSALLRHRLGAQRWIAAGGGLLWVTFPFLAQVGRNWIVVTYSAMVLPLNLLALESLLRRPSPSRIAALAAVKALYFYQGYVQYPVLAALLDLFYLGARWLVDSEARRRWSRSAAAYAVAILGCGLLAAPVLLPMLEAKSLSAYRTGSLSFEEFISNAMPLGSFVDAQMLRPTGPVIHQAGASIFYVGAPCLLALLLLLFFLRRRPGAGPFVAAGLVALLALLFSTRAYGVAYWLPLLSSFRWPFKFFLLFLFFTTVAVVGACELVRRRRPRDGQWLAALVLTVAIGTNLAVLFDPAHDRPFGPNRLHGTVEELVAETAERLGDPSAGRVVSLWLAPDESRIARYLIFNFASLANAYHLGGYDPLIARSRLDLAMGLEFSNIFRWDLDPRALEHLSSWSVRYLLVPSRDELRSRIESLPLLRLLSSRDGIDVWENPAAWPFAAFVDSPYQALETRFLANEVRIETKGRSGPVRITLAPLAAYRAYADDRPIPLAETPSHHLVIEVPPTCAEVRIRFEDSGIRLGGALALLALLGFGGWIYRTRTDSEPRTT